MVKNFLLFIKYPYTAGIIAIIWLGSAAFLAIDDSLSVVEITSFDLGITVLIALIGFRGKQEV